MSEQVVLNSDDNTIEEIVIALKEYNYDVNGIEAIVNFMGNGAEKKTVTLYRQQ